MNPRFQKHVERLESKFKDLKKAKSYKVPSLPKGMPKEGIYLFSEGRKHLYVGRSRRLKGRIRYHASGKYLQASFAFLLAREATGNPAPTYSKKGGRSDLQNRPEFRKAFEKCTARIRAMDVRFIEEENSVTQALLEIYAAVALNTKYNKFTTS